MPHEDGPAFTPVIATITLGSHTILNIYEKLCSICKTGICSCTNAVGIFSSSLDDSDGRGNDTGKTGICGGNGSIGDSSGASYDAPPFATQKIAMKLLLQPNSLVILRGDIYGYLHGIAECSSDVIDSSVINLSKCPSVNIGQTLNRSTRISITIRNVPNVKKLPKIGNFKK